MVKEGLFYEKDSLSTKDVLTLIGLWEGDAGESFTDCCSFPNEIDRGFFKYLESEYPELHEYVLKDIGDNRWSDIQTIFDLCVDYYTSWVPDGNIYLWDKQYTLAYWPLAEFILKDDEAWKHFVMFFTDTSNTVSGTPWIDCYDIRKDFENGKF